MWDARQSPRGNAEEGEQDCEPYFFVLCCLYVVVVGSLCMRWLITFFVPVHVNIVCQVDKLSFKEQMATVLFKLGRFDESESIYRSLLFMNPDNYK
jgi:hypothetical protein